MDFFTAQEQARQKSRWLVFWFVLAVLGIITVIYLGATFWVAYKESAVQTFTYRLFTGSLLVITFVLGLFAYFTWMGSRAVSAIFVIAAIFLALFSIWWINLLFGGEQVLQSMEHPLFENKMQIQPAHAFQFWDSKRFFLIFLPVGGSIAVASLFKIWQISRHGGTLIAEQLGGRMITRETSDPAEKRLLNVIDEMSIAAGIPAPLAFVLPEERSLNAFAAGLSTQDSVIGVTQGLLEAMNRDELQGVIGHEVSHIINGDSRLNIKLIGILFGIYAITLIGRFMMRVRGRNAAPAVLGGLVLCVVGSIGLFFGRLIQAAVSREREYLADASAVQFTRHPAGLASALNKLLNSGSQIERPEATAASHLFFGAIGSSLFATHPPLDDRIRRLGGKQLLRRQEKEAFQSSIDVASVEAHRPQSLAANPHAVMPISSLGALAGTVAEEIPSASMTQAQSLLANLPEPLRQQVWHVTGATGIIGGLFFSRQPDVRFQQEKLLSPAALPTAQELYRWLSSQPEQGAHYRIAWLDLALPTLREAPKAERQQLIALTAALIHADGHVSPSEFALYSIMRNVLLPPSAHRAKRSKLRTNRLDQDIGNLLALIAHAGHEDLETAKAAYQAAMGCSPASTPPPFPSITEISLNTISQSLAHLALTTPPYREKLLSACAIAIHYDGKVTPVENELLRAFAQSLDCPAPLMEICNQ
ncbi:MAG: M48 family metallopeptidase [Betaproteobacteria bacterium]|nr:M48 family metallopeptidase [Betaproteobacteria bacterium]